MWQIGVSLILFSDHVFVTVCPNQNYWYIVKICCRVLCGRVGKNAWAVAVAAIDTFCPTVWGLGHNSREELGKIRKLGHILAGV